MLPEHAEDYLLNPRTSMLLDASVRRRRHKCGALLSLQYMSDCSLPNLQTTH